MKNAYRVLPVVSAAVLLLAVSCAPAPGGGGTANLAPIAVATASPLSGNAPLSAAFDGSNSLDADGSIVSYSWSFGNGTNGSGVTSTGNYPTAGAFTAVLTVTDNKGATDTDSLTITVNGDGDGDGVFVPSDCNDADSTIFPGAADPAGDNIDSNCDGIDGTESAAVFVNSSTGANTSTCGTILEPCASITQGQSRAVAESKSSVFVAGGSYSKFTVQAGLEVRGGYGQNFQRGVLATSPSIATVTAAFDATVNGPVGVIADGISTATRVADLNIVGATASAGNSSYGVFVRNSTSALVLDSLNISGGVAGAGSAGAAGSSGWSGTAGTGSNGGDGFEPGGACNTSSAGGGGAGGGGANSGGSGGKGGVVDGSCGWTGLCSNCDAQTGNSGGSGGGVGGGGGGAGGTAATDGLVGICTLGGTGPSLRGGSGSSGANGTAGGAGSGGSAGANGATGLLGANGAGGGAGGG
ncbi:MAG: PKD domain-containing protein, partial [Actinomycetes bacterium]